MHLSEVQECAAASDEAVASPSTSITVLNLMETQKDREHCVMKAPLPKERATCSHKCIRLCQARHVQANASLLHLQASCVHCVVFRHEGLHQRPTLWWTSSSVCAPSMHTCLNKDKEEEPARFLLQVARQVCTPEEN